MPTIKINITQQSLEDLFKNGEITINIGMENHLSQINESTKHDTFFELMTQLITRMKETGNIRTSETYRTALNHFQRFRNNQDLSFKDISPELMEEYQNYLLAMNTVSFHMRILRAVYYKGIHRGLTYDAKPFRNVYTGKAQTQKRSLTIEDMHKIKKIKLDTKKLEFARDLFLLSFYLRGMSFVDLAYLKKSDIHNNILIYKRRKTGQLLRIKWEQPMQKIVNRYKCQQSNYLLPIIKKDNGKELNQYRYWLLKTNIRLKEVAKKAGINFNLTMYCARHTWATIARDIHTPMNIISSAMGHTHEKTTEIYIKTIDCDIVDKANEQIIKLI